MTEHDPEAWLNHARQALSPGEADQARVLTALEHRLDLPSNDLTNEVAREPGRVDHPELNNVSATSTGSAVSPLGVPSTVLHWALGAIITLTGVAAVSLYLTTATPKPPVQKPATSATMLDLPIAHIDQDEKLHTPAPEPAPPAPKEKKPRRKKCRTAQGTERPCTTVKASETAVASAPPPEAAAPRSSLAQELAALREAQRALRDGQAAHALSVLTSFEQTAAGPGAMQEERSAAATMARCALALPDETRRGRAQELYDDFVRRYPKSAYAARLELTCLQKRPR